MPAKNLRALCLHSSLVPVLALLAAAPAYAQDSGEDKPKEEKLSDDLHDRRVNEDGIIIVSAVGVTQLDILAGTSVMEGAALQRNLDGQLGEVLAKLPGVSATGFSEFDAVGQRDQTDLLMRLDYGYEESPAFSLPVLCIFSYFVDNGGVSSRN